MAASVVKKAQSPQRLERTLILNETFKKKPCLQPVEQKIAADL